MRLLVGMMDAALAPTVDRAASPGVAWDVALGIAFIGCGTLLGLVLVAIAAAGPLSVAQADQLWMMSFGLLFVIGIGALLTRSGAEGGRRAAEEDDSTLFAAGFILFIMAPCNVLLRHVFDPHEETEVRALLGLFLLVPNFFVCRLIQAAASLARERRTNRK
ncbi:MAG TPA: hypothetical protein VFK70_04660 [Vicinamibacteria bacterium]|nr:hypothetical protein [Vicinamibacteria bacterium]